MNDTQRILARLNQLLSTRWQSYIDSESQANAVHERLQGTLTLLTLAYGAGSHQVKLVLSAVDRSSKYSQPLDHLTELVWPATEGALRSLQADVEGGLVGRIELRAAGQTLGDFLVLAKDSLSHSEPASKNVAAVLAAAAFEDTVRQMGERLAGVLERPKLADVLVALKTQGVLTGPSIATAQGYLKFRNDALHANWEQIDRAVVGSCVAFTEGLLLAHFS